jgi:hypothetical protein
MKTNFVLESFDEFIKFVSEAKVYEAETGYIGSLVDSLTGGMKLEGGSKKRVSDLISADLNQYYTDGVVNGKEMAESIKSKIEETFNVLNNVNGKIETKKGLVTDYMLPGYFKYLEDGTVKAEGHPNNDPEDSRVGLEMERLPLGELLARVNKHNLLAFYTNVKQAREAEKNKKGDNFVNAGTESSVNEFKKRSGGDGSNRFIQINAGSLKGDTIQFNEYVATEWSADPSSILGVTTHGYQFPIYTVFDIQPGKGNAVDSSIYDEVIQPAGSSVEVTEKEYNSSGINFFEENAVVISEAGKKAVNAILSQYNSISKITVNGGASSKPTSRAGGNEKLAKDRQVAGIAILNELKKSGVAQLKSAAVTAGTAAVQSAAPTESDPKNQQVSFIISGKIKATQIIEKGPETIEKIENMKADQCRFKKYTFNVALSAGPSTSNLS